jgi:hypothetical protein
MNTRLWRLLPAVLALLPGCEDAEANPFQGPVNQGVEECEKYQAFTSPAKHECTDCLHRECAPAWQSMSLVCAGDPSTRCEAVTGKGGSGGSGGSKDGGVEAGTDGGVDAGPATKASFCTCVTSLPNGCGYAVGNVYACFANECAKDCSASGAGGSAGKGGSAGYGGSKDAGFDGI